MANETFFKEKEFNGFSRNVIREDRIKKFVKWF